MFGNEGYINPLSLLEFCFPLSFVSMHMGDVVVDIKIANQRQRCDGDSV